MSQRIRHDQSREFLTDLPSELTMEILSRLPVLSVKSCKCVCKTWLNLLETDEFVKSHLSKATPGLAVNDPDSCIIYDFNDRLNLQEHELHYDPIIDFKFIHYGVIQGSVNGVLLMCYQSVDPNDLDLLFLLNPITFEYINVRSCEDFVFKEDRVVCYGFGESGKTRQLKVVRMCHDCVRDEETEELLSIHELDCRVYTLGTGLWRSIAHDLLLEYDPCSIGAFLHGNLHWLAFDADGWPLVSCFDLEEEVFSFFPCPEISGGGELLLDLHAMEDRLCLSDNGSDEEFAVWFMRDYGTKTWTKEVVISKREIPFYVRRPFSVRLHHVIARAVKIFKDGDVLMVWGGRSFFYYSSKTKTIRELDVFETYTSIDTILHTSSFFSLEGFGDEKVCSFRGFL